MSGNGITRGIAGMRERAALLGGTFSAGPAEGGGFLVSARLPWKEI
jgi:signal transduction histidine kinase